MEEYIQNTPYDSPWTFSQKLKMFLWEYIWLFFCSWTPKPANPLRLFILRSFGATLYGKPFVHQRAKIQIPWNLTMHNRACLGDGANVYSLGEIEIHEHATVAQEAYLCTGTHAFNKKSMNLLTSKITIGQHAFIGARAFIMPGIEVGEYAVVGACSVVTKSIDAYTISAGNPSKTRGKRTIEGS